MKYLLRFLTFAIVLGIGVGFYLKNTENPYGEIIIGLSVLALAFLFMPLFIYYRYKDKKPDDFLLVPKDKQKK